MGYDPLAWIKEEEQGVASPTEVPVDEPPSSLVPAVSEAVPPPLQIQDQGAVAQSPEPAKSEATVQNEITDLGEILGIADVVTLKESLLGCLEKGKPVTLDVSGLDSVDTAALQLLLAFRIEAQKRGIDVHWKKPSETLLDNARIIGLERHLGLVA